MTTTDIEASKQLAAAWFERLRDEICAAFETLEDDAPAALYPGAAGPLRPHAVGAHRPRRRARRRRRDVGDARPAVREGRRPLSRPSTANSRRNSAARFPAPQTIRASGPRGISLIAHQRNPNVPAVHMNTRFVVTTKAWFGGGADLTPVLDRRRTQHDPDTVAFHAAMQAACDAHAAWRPTTSFKTWCDEYFYLPAPQGAARHRRHLLRLSR